MDIQTYTLITGNDNKAREVAEILGVPIKREKIELEEMQTLDLNKIVEQKLIQAYKILKTPVMVEDVSLVFHSFGKLPGPFIKWFNQEIGVENYPRLLESYPNKKMTATCLFGLYDGINRYYFEGAIEGTMAKEPKGSWGFGFDCIFIPQNTSLTLAQLPSEEKNKISHRAKALAKMKEYFTKVMNPIGESQNRY